MENPRRPIAITGTARSGTKYTTLLLHKHKVHIGHERINSGGIVSWFHAPVLDPSTITILHQVRHPLKSMASFGTLTEDSWRYIFWYLPHIDFLDDPIVQYMQYWLDWNKIAAQKSVMTYRVEAIEEVLNDICRHAEVMPKHEMLGKVARTVNSRQEHTAYRRLTWKDLYVADRKLAERVEEMARSYGYTEEEE